MKKMLALVMLLSVASLATAGISLVQSGQNQAVIDITPIETGNFYLTLEQGNGYNVTLGPSAGSLNEVGAIEDYADGFDWRFMTVAGAPGAEPVDGVQFIIDLTTAGPMTVQLYDASGYVAIGEAVTLGVPEPATMALLGLGALVLRRKK